MQCDVTCKLARPPVRTLKVSKGQSWGLMSMLVAEVIQDKSHSALRIGSKKARQEGMLNFGVRIAVDAFTLIQVVIEGLLLNGCSLWKQ